MAKKAELSPAKRKSGQKQPAGASLKTEKYFESLGRRKTATARIRLKKGKGEIFVNSKGIKGYFQSAAFQNIASSPLTNLKIADKFDVSAKVIGGGLRAQAEAIRLGLSRALIVLNPDFKKRLRNLGFLTRDPRMVERKKYGYKKARRAPQWKKR